MHWKTHTHTFEVKYYRIFFQLMRNAFGDEECQCISYANSTIHRILSVIHLRISPSQWCIRYLRNSECI